MLSILRELLKRRLLLYCKAVKSKKPAITESSFFSTLTVDVYTIRLYLRRYRSKYNKRNTRERKRYEKGIDRYIHFAGPIFGPKRKRKPEVGRICKFWSYNRRMYCNEPCGKYSSRISFFLRTSFSKLTFCYTVSWALRQ
jgi:hypothetical protein